MFRQIIHVFQLLKNSSVGKGVIGHCGFPVCVKIIGSETVVATAAAWYWNCPGAFPRLPKEQEFGHSLVKLPLLTTISSVASFCPTSLKSLRLSWFSVFVSLTENASQ